MFSLVEQKDWRQRETASIASPSLSLYSIMTPQAGTEVVTEGKKKPKKHK